MSWLPLLAIFRRFIFLLSLPFNLWCSYSSLLCNESLTLSGFILHFLYHAWCIIFLFLVKLRLKFLSVWRVVVRVTREEEMFCQCRALASIPAKTKQNSNHLSIWGKAWESPTIKRKENLFLAIVGESRSLVTGVKEKVILTHDF